MKNFSKLRMFHAASSGLVLAVIPTFLIITFLSGVVASHPLADIMQVVLYFAWSIGITLWIYSSDAEFQIYYCPGCSHEWSQKRHRDDSCPKCNSQKYIYNYRP